MMNLLACGSVYFLVLLGAVWAFWQGWQKQVHFVVTGFFFGMVLYLVPFVLGLFVYCVDEAVANAAFPALRVCMIGGPVLSAICLPVGLIIGIRADRKKAKLVDRRLDE